MHPTLDFFCYLCAIMKLKDNLIKWIPKIIVAFGLYLLTGSFAMSLGIIILVIVAEYLVVELWETRRKNKSRDEKL